jgi:hypothetical protein
VSSNSITAPCRNSSEVLSHTTWTPRCVNTLRWWSRRQALGPHWACMCAGCSGQGRGGGARPAVCQARRSRIVRLGLVV